MLWLKLSPPYKDLHVKARKLGGFSVELDKIDKIKGLNISIVTTARTDAEGKQLLSLLGMPFRN